MRWLNGSRCADGGDSPGEESYRAFRYVDYLSLIKTPDGWRIVHKGYHQEKSRAERNDVRCSSFRKCRRTR